MNKERDMKPMTKEEEYRNADVPMPNDLLNAANTENFKNNYPEYSLLFAYNHSKEIMDKEKNFNENGGKWILYVPEVKII